MPNDSLGIVLPAYKVDLEKLNEYIEAMDDDLSPEEIIVEYDNPENTEGISSDVNLQIFQSRRGKGAAIKHGFNELETDILIFADSDGSVPTESLIEIIEAIRDGADLAAGSRRHPEAESGYHQTYVRKILGDLLAKVAGTLLEPDLYDYQCGAKAIRKDKWDEIEENITKTGFGFDLELIHEAGKNNFNIQEVPVEWIDQPGSTVSVVRDSYRISKVLFELSGDKK